MDPPRHAGIDIFDLHGRMVRTLLARKEVSAGWTFDACNGETIAVRRVPAESISSESRPLRWSFWRKRSSWSRTSPSVANIPGPGWISPSTSHSAGPSHIWARRWMTVATAAGSPIARRPKPASLSMPPLHRTTLDAHRVSVLQKGPLRTASLPGELRILPGVHGECPIRIQRQDMQPSLQGRCR